MVCHWDDVPEQPVEAGPMRAAWVDLGSAAGSVHLGPAPRPPGIGVAHAFRGGSDGLTLLAYGQRRRDDLVFCPRSSKVELRGAGVMLGVTAVDCWDGEA
jgi:hypothetical protein